MSAETQPDDFTSLLAKSVSAANENYSRAEKDFRRIANDLSGAIGSVGAGLKVWLGTYPPSTEFTAFDMRVVSTHTEKVYFTVGVYVVTCRGYPIYCFTRYDKDIITDVVNGAYDDARHDATPDIWKRTMKDCQRAVKTSQQ